MTPNRGRTAQRRCLALAAAAAALWAGSPLAAQSAAARSTALKQRLRAAAPRQTTNPTVQNQFLQLIVNRTSGRIGLRTTGGDPDVASDDNQDLTFNALTPATSFTTIRVTTDANGLPRTTPQDTRFQGPSVVDSARGQIASVMQSTSTLDVSVRQVLRLVRHSLEIRYEVTNASAVNQDVGLRIMIDTQLGPNDGAPFLLTKEGQITTEREFLTPNIPSEWIATSDLTAPTVMSQGVLIGSEATPPDRFVIADWRVINPTLYDYTIDTARDITTDSAMAVFWYPQPLRPGETRVYVTYYGLGYATADFASPFVVATDSPFALNYVNTDDLGTPETEASLNPNPMTINGAVYNTSLTPMSRMKLSLDLPDGLRLTGSQSPIANLGVVNSLVDALASWQVEATGETAGKLTYRITASGAPFSAKVITRSINVPALPQGFSYPAGVSMVALPFQFSNPDPAAVFGFARGDVRLARWDPRTSSYEFFPLDQGASTLQPGQGYWLRLDSTTPIALRGATPVPASSSFPVALEKGWNQIGNPYGIGVVMGRFLVAFGNATFTFDQAISQGLIRGTLFEYDTAAGSYKFFTDDATQLEPRKGYWIRALADCFLLIQSTEVIGAIRSAPHAPSSRPSLDWRLRLTAETNGIHDLQNYIGVGAGFTSGFDARGDIEEPPPGERFVTIRFPHRDWGEQGTHFCQDVRSNSSPDETWDMEVATSESQSDVTLSWPDIQSVPRTVSLVLTDLDSGQRVYMRTRNSYTFTSGEAGAPRRFRISAVSAGSGPLAVGSVTTRGGPGGGVTVAFTLSRSAEVRCLVRTPTGRIVRELRSGGPLAAGVNSLHWDRRDAAGRRAPPGIYLLDIEATTDQLQSARGLGVARLSP